MSKAKNEWKLESNFNVQFTFNENGVLKLLWKFGNI